jgi:flagellar biosynthetic protein FliP
VRSAPAPRRVLFIVTLIIAGALAQPALAQDIRAVDGALDAPSILVMMTSFTRIVVVLSLLRTAMGTATAPPNSVIIALAMFLTAFVI